MGSASDDEWTGLHTGMENKRQKLGAREKTPGIEDNLGLSEADDMEEANKTDDDQVQYDRDEEYEAYLYQRIVQIQSDINSHPTTHRRHVAQKNIQDQLAPIKDRVSPLGSNLHVVEHSISA